MLSFLDRLLITFFDYEPFAEIHGFEHRRFDEFLGVDASDKKPLKIGRGGVFGGPRAYLEAATAVYEIALSETLSHGVMGTEENLFSILDYRFPELVHHYDNNDGGNCAIFDEWARHIDFKVSGYDVRGTYLCAFVPLCLCRRACVLLSTSCLFCDVPFRRPPACTQGCNAAS